MRCTGRRILWKTSTLLGPLHTQAPFASTPMRVSTAGYDADILCGKRYEDHLSRMQLRKLTIAIPNILDPKEPDLRPKPLHRS